MKIAVCGANSSVGKSFINKTKDMYEIVTLGRRYADVYVDLAIRDISNIEQKGLKDCDVFINFAAQASAIDDLDLINMMEVNIIGPLYLAQIAKQNNIKRFIEISSISATYGRNNPFYGYYSQSKKAADDLLERYCKANDLELCILRPTAMFGDESFSKHQKLFYGLLEKVKNKEAISLNGNLDAKRNYICVNTLIEVVDRICKSNISGTYNVLNLKNDSLTEIINDMDRFYNTKTVVTFLKDKPNIYEQNYSFDNVIYEKLGMEPPKGVYMELLKINSNKD